MSVKKSDKLQNPQDVLPIIKRDPYLEPYSKAIEGRYRHAADKCAELIANVGSLSSFASGYMYYGLHKIQAHWTLR